MSSSSNASVLHEGLYDRKEELKKQFEVNSKPYPHLVIENLCSPQIASLMTEEIKSFHGVLKETDLFKGRVVMEKNKKNSNFPI